MSLLTFVVVSVLSHDNQTFNAGDTIQLDEKTAAPLLAVGCIETPAEAQEEMKAADKIKLIEVADTVEAVEELVSGDDRKTVVAAAAARLKELAESK